MDKIQLNDITLNNARQEDEAAAPEFAPGQFAPGRRVTMHFELSLPGGDIIDSNFDGDPVTFTVGDGNLLPKFEQAIFGLASGEEKTVELPPQQAFGEHIPGNIQTFPRFRFPADLALEVGLMINFADSAGNEQPGVVTEFNSSHVTVDFNHPLAERTVHFRVKILEVAD